jgi:N-acyl-D-amino-acid deacylase
MPAEHLGLDRRGRLQPGFFADVVVFDPTRIEDRATYEQPQQYATGVEHVFVNGAHVLRDGEHTGATPGRALRRAASMNFVGDGLRDALDPRSVR